MEITLIGRIDTSTHGQFCARIPRREGFRHYDAVIVMGVNESFSDTTFNKKLLYIATTSKSTTLPSTGRGVSPRY